MLRAAWLMGSSSCIPSQDQAARMHDKIVGCRMLGAGEQRGELSMSPKQKRIKNCKRKAIYTSQTLGLRPTYGG